MGGQAFWHPQVALTDVPAWISHSDACAVPYRLNTFTLASHPLKAIEYLAMGVPVVSTRVPSLVQYGDALMWVDEGDPQGYASALDRCITERADPQRSEQRRHAVEDASWQNGMNRFKKTVFSESP
jgi:glycosyltransferase involved in cell wall biosynthesis